MPTLRLRFPSNRTLANICVYGAVASVSAVMYMHWSFQDRIRRTEYFRLAFNTLRQHKGAINLLGEPIKDSGFDLANTNNSCDAEHAKFEVKVRGSKDKGTVYFWATNNNENGWLIDRLELETKQHPNKRFLLKRALDDQASKHLEPSAEAKKQFIVTPGSDASPPVERATINPKTNASDNNVQQHPRFDQPPPAAASEPSVRDHGNDAYAKHRHQQHTSELPASVTDVQTDVTTAPSAAAGARVNSVSEQQHQLHQANVSAPNHQSASQLNHQIKESPSPPVSSEPGVDQKVDAANQKDLGMVDDHVVLVVSQEGPHSNKCTNQNHYTQRN